MAACTGAGTGAGARGPGSSSAGPPGTPATSGAPTAPVPTPAVPTAPNPTAVPRTTAGPLSSANVPPPSAIPGFTPHVDEGDAADGYAGNGTFVRERDVAEVAAAMQPLGCARSGAVRLPVPRHALEATYRGPDGAPAVAVVAEYASEDEARRTVAGLASVLRSCPRIGSPPRGAEVSVDVLRATADDVVDRRAENAPGATGRWLEVVVRVGDRVALTAVAVPPGARAPDAARLAAVLRRVAAR